mmetsp:Transcript_10436/g.24549  ORF Transcript_10436/g.24549 Transcript_10436/m.24549 type:complete len:235 (-) Transcript_10436:35-739(-)
MAFELEPPKPCTVTLENDAAPDAKSISLFTSAKSSKPLVSRLGFTVMRWQFGVAAESWLVMIALMSAKAPAFSLAWPTLLFTEPITSSGMCCTPTPSGLARRAKRAVPMSTTSDISRPSPWTSATSTSNAEICASSRALPMISWMAGPCGALTFAAIPLQFVPVDAKTPCGGQPFSWMTGSPSTYLASGLTMQPDTPSLRAMPLALASKVRQRPTAVRHPAAVWRDRARLASIK